MKRIFWFVSMMMVVSSGVTRGEGITLRWTAPGDDGYRGRAVEYDLRYSKGAISSQSWYQATRVPGVTVPAEAGQRESFTVEGLDDNESYFFAIRTRDDAGNWSDISNVVVRAVCQFGCLGIRGNVNGDPDEQISISDIQYLVDHLFAIPLGPKPICPLEANSNGDDQEYINVSDINYLINYLFGSPPGPAPPPCP